MKNLVMTVLSVTALIVSVAGSAFADGPTQPIPEPGTLVLLGIGAAGLIAYKKIKK
ncbi:MAG: PEP-CTERM sorting domain-containing protein [Pedobacter sp.]